MPQARTDEWLRCSPPTAKTLVFCSFHLCWSVFGCGRGPSLSMTSESRMDCNDACVRIVELLVSLHYLPFPFRLAHKYPSLNDCHCMGMWIFDRTETSLSSQHPGSSTAVGWYIFGLVQLLLWRFWNGWTEPETRQHKSNEFDKTSNYRQHFQ